MPHYDFHNFSVYYEFYQQTHPRILKISFHPDILIEAILIKKRVQQNYFQKDLERFFTLETGP